MTITMNKKNIELTIKNVTKYIANTNASCLVDTYLASLDL